MTTTLVMGNILYKTHNILSVKIIEKNVILSNKFELKIFPYLCIRKTDKMCCFFLFISYLVTFFYNKITRMNESYEMHFSRIILLLNGFGTMLYRTFHLSFSQSLIHNKMEKYCI